METRRPISQQSQAETLGQNDDVLELEEEIREVEEQVNQIADKVADCRTSLPGQLNTTFGSILAAQRPVLNTEGPESQPGCSNDPPTSDVEGPSQRGAALAGEVQKEDEKAQLLKQKITSNASAIPIVLKRMKEAMARIDKLQSSKKVIHPAFKRRRISS
ncbi:hypothetical protein K7X08_026434 [Anisodus acutangulus]|uniref:Uncharacterized protein n=1 Tax=Anisodus acutangulus TaxID=402998 RepID=A0A9Q1LLN0_9SOLA|nr:hypothetical protein K7X08_026434 [Anisodus acutangulus]